MTRAFYDVLCLLGFDKPAGKKPKLPINEKLNAAKSKRVMRSEQGMRPRESVHARKIERRARHAVKGNPCNK